MKNKKKKGSGSAHVFATEGDDNLLGSFLDLFPAELREQAQESAESRDSEPDENAETGSFLNPAAYKLYVRIEHKGRKGKTVTLVEKIEDIAEEDIAWLCKELKTHCGSGGSFSDSHILIQGNHKQKIIHFLQGMGFKTNAS